MPEGPIHLEVMKAGNFSLIHISAQHRVYLLSFSAWMLLKFHGVLRACITNSPTKILFLPEIFFLIITILFGQMFKFKS